MKHFYFKSHTQRLARMQPPTRIVSNQIELQVPLVLLSNFLIFIKLEAILPTNDFDKKYFSLFGSHIHPTQPVQCWCFFFVVWQNRLSMHSISLNFPRDMGLALYRKVIMDDPEIKYQALKLILDEIRKDRQSLSVDRAMIKSLLRMLVDFQLYAEVFEHRFLRETDAFYQQEATRLIQSLSIPDYLVHSECRLKEEEERVVWYLDSNTRQPLIHTVEKELIARQSPVFLEAKNLRSLMSGTNSGTDSGSKLPIQDLLLLYKLLARVNALEQLRISFGDYIRVSKIFNSLMNFFVLFIE